ncbi:hypothetical protein ACFY84_16700 [Streptomyces sp. NPDC012438]|uniref:hypothetical protein n=1 Tax=Streptomyces sp. NPDC012438 TaxID=3364833 RepID=UPI0036DFEE53
MSRSRGHGPLPRLWEDFALPAEDALHYADGRSYGVVLDPAAPGGFAVLAPFDLGEVLEADPARVSSVDGLAVADLGEGGLLWGGEGSHGSEGFLARLTTDRALVWAVFFSESNPFSRVRLSGNVAAFTSTSGFEVTVDIDDPRAPLPVRNRTV